MHTAWCRWLQQIPAFVHNWETDLIEYSSCRSKIIIIMGLFDSIQVDFKQITMDSPSNCSTVIF